MFTMIKQFPGKLFLMGEYFVTDDFGQAIIIAVNRFIEIEAKQSDEFILKSDYGIIQEGQTSTESMKIALEAVTLAYEYLTYLKIEHRSLDIKVTSSLLEDGVKIGLGSSAVVLVALIQTILENHHVYLEKVKLFKLTVLCQKRLGDLSSGGDVAASIYSGMIHYKKYSNQWLSEQECTLELLDLPWPGLSIKNLKVPEGFELMVAWTGIPNKTYSFLEVFNLCKEKDPNTYKKFTKRAQEYVSMFVDGSFEEAIASYRQLMLELEAWTKLNIETQELKIAIEIASIYNAYAKISGSGGGDCMFALLPKANINNKKLIIDSWTKNNIKYLELGVWN